MHFIRSGAIHFVSLEAGLVERDLPLGGVSILAAKLAVCFTALVLIAASPASAQPSPPRPNIVYIVADDLGWKDVGFHGSDIKTPNVDKLAETGARLEQFYVQPMCTPTRAALLTGRYPFRYGLQTAVIPTPSKYGLATDERLLPQALKEAGYVTRLWGEDAVAQINAHDPKTPFFLYLAFTAPHAPYQAPKEYLDKYKHIEDPTRRAYAAMITAMDDEIGNVVGALDKKGIRDNTLIVFMSDNGGNRTAMLSGDVDVSNLKLPADNGPYRGGKGMLYEGGTRVVALANWPGHIKPGVNNEIIHVVDMFPTLAGLAGASLSKGKPLDGVDVWSTLSDGKPSPRHEVVYNIEPFRGGVREGDWKLIWRTPLPSALELYNIAEDPSEKTNLADKNPQIVAKLQKRIEELARESAKSLFLQDAFTAVKASTHGAPALPGEDAFFTQGD